MKKHSGIYGMLSFLPGILTAAVLSVTVYADLASPCSMHIDYNDEGTALEGAVFRAFYTADLSEDGGFDLADTFRDSGAVLMKPEEMSNEQWMDASDIISDWIKMNTIEPDRQGATDSEGHLNFTNLPQGLYFIEGDALKIEDRTLIPQAFCVAVPQKYRNGDYDYDVFLSPKFQVLKVPESETTGTPPPENPDPDDPSEPTDPAAPNNPSITPDSDDPSETPDPDDPLVTPDPDDPSVTPDPDDPSVTPDPYDPSATPDPNDPSVTPDPDDPSMTPDPNDPSVTPDPDDPSLTPDPADPSATPDPGDPSAAPTVTPGDPNSSGDDPPVDVYDPPSGPSDPPSDPNDPPYVPPPGTNVYDPPETYTSSDGTPKTGDDAPFLQFVCCALLALGAGGTAAVWIRRSRKEE